MTELNRRALLRAAALAGAATATGLAGGLAAAAPAAAAETTEVVNGPWLVSVGWGVLQVNPGRTTPQRLLDDGDQATTSPDGRYVAWINNARSGDGSLEPYVSLYDRVTGEIRTLLADPFGVVYGAPTWSPDGTQIALVIDRDTLVAVDVATAAKRVLVQGHAMSQPNWSRDGSMIVMRWTSRSEGPQLRTLEVATGKVRPIYTPEAAGELFHGPVFMPNSERVVFCTNRWTRDTEVLGGQALGSVRIDGTGLKRLTDETRYYQSPVFSPDGRYCAALSVPPTNEAPDGGNIIVSTSGFGEPWWIPGDEYDDSSRLDWARAI
ncbi:LpqB family beta-propeller domain-containing protein [Micromonospora sp. A3M-1-15]|uniref:TolB family protein n=1 Tax=Micromonospora TaxID=1873 RepID=UPI0020B8F828|nr:LpqB family beta-propeller domain-containing protein [Micromonospora sp. A3M-1-15]MCP3787168.1 LpqB family beta-propeller domain-containing protein [Micromonospora sp. A3M-1-15]